MFSYVRSFAHDSPTYFTPVLSLRHPTTEENPASGEPIAETAKIAKDLAPNGSHDSFSEAKIEISDLDCLDFDDNVPKEYEDDQHTES